MPSSIPTNNVNNTIAEPNPLDTPDQYELDQLAIDIYQKHPFHLLKLEAKIAYKIAHGLFLNREENVLLNPAIEELLFSAIQKAVNNNPTDPKVYWVNKEDHNYRNLNVPGGRYSYDNPDTIYRIIPINGKFNYIIDGFRYQKELADATFSLIDNPNFQGTINILTNKELQINADGSYQITIDSQPDNGRPNHIQSTPKACQLLIRHALGNWLSQTPDKLSIKALNASNKETQDENKILIQATKNLEESILAYAVGALAIKTMIHPTNTLSSPSQSSTLGTLTTQFSSFGHFKLDDDSALIITLNSGNADYFVVPVTNPWMITTEPGNYLNSINSQHAIPNNDGLYRFVISKKDPSVSQWISTSGLQRGTIMLRWQNLPMGNSPSCSTEVLPIKELKQKLPTDTIWVTDIERKKQLTDRFNGYERRYL